MKTKVWSKINQIYHENSKPGITKQIKFTMKPKLGITKENMAKQTNHSKTKKRQNKLNLLWKIHVCKMWSL